MIRNMVGKGVGVGVRYIYVWVYCVEFPVTFDYSLTETKIAVYRPISRLDRFLNWKHASAQILQ